MKTLEEVLTLCTQYLLDKGVDNARRQAEELLADALSIKRIDLYLQYQRPLNKQELSKCRERLMRRGQGEPSAYIHGSVDFYSCCIQVDSRVLIPRPETELLVDIIVKDLSSQQLRIASLWDMCTGSGCIGISLKKALKELDVVLSDISSDALEIAKKNARLNAVSVDFKCGDLFIPFEGQKADYIVCNPPYISSSEYQDLDGGVKNFEPKQALLAGNRGTEYYERLSKSLRHYLLPGGKAWFEIGDGQGEIIKSLFQESCWKRAEYQCDWAGRHRFFFLEIE